MVDKLNSRRMKIKVTGNSRRESYRYAPTSRMTNTYIAPGDSTKEEIIGSISEGLYAKKLGGVLLILLQESLTFLFKSDI